jgi:ribosomal protein S18 acetylase RimI-like enzyme
MEPTLRSATPADIGAIHELHHRIQAHDRIPTPMSRAEFDDWLEEPHFDLAADTRVVEIDGRMTAWGRVWHHPSGVREERAYVIGGVAPEQRGRGIGSALIRWEMERATIKLRSCGDDLPKHIRTYAYDFESATRALYARHGLEIVRYADELLRELGAPAEQVAVEGITIVPWDAARSDEARRAQNEAFADHWGSTPHDGPSWEHLIHSHGTRLDLSFMALEGDHLIGLTRNGVFPDEEAVSGRRDGWILQVSVLRSHRRRGIASALIAASLDRFRAAGLTHSVLGVDSENPTGAYRIYERLGYRPIHRMVVYQKPV